MVWFELFSINVAYKGLHDHLRGQLHKPQICGILDICVLLKKKVVASVSRVLAWCTIMSFHIICEREVPSPDF